MIPSPWVAAVLTLAVFRTVRLIGYDTFPPVARARAWATGAAATRAGSANASMGLTGEERPVTVTYRRPTLAYLLACAYCLSLWTAALVYAWWVLSPRSCLYAAVPFALSSAVGLIARHWDP